MGAVNADISGDGLSHAGVKKRFLEMTEGESALIEEPLDSGLWPTAGLSDDQLAVLIKALREVRLREMAGV